MTEQVGVVRVVNWQAERRVRHRSLLERHQLTIPVPPQSQEPSTRQRHLRGSSYRPSRIHFLHSDSHQRQLNTRLRVEECGTPEARPGGGEEEPN